MVLASPKPDSTHSTPLGNPRPILDAEIAIAVACAIVLATSLPMGRCGVPETIAMLGLGLSLYAIFHALYKQRRGKPGQGAHSSLSR